MKKPLHHIFLVNDDCPAVVIQHKDITSCEELSGCILVLQAADGTEYRYSKAKWRLYDLTLSEGWNHSAVEDSTVQQCVQDVLARTAPSFAKTEAKEVQIAVPFIMERRSEEKVWDEMLYITLSKEAYTAAGADWWRRPDFILSQVRSAVTDWLRNNNSECSMKWGDLISHLPMEEHGIRVSLERQVSLPISSSVQLHVDRDAAAEYPVAHI